MCLRSMRYLYQLRIFEDYCESAENPATVQRAKAKFNIMFYFTNFFKVASLLFYSDIIKPVFNSKLRFPFAEINNKLSRTN